MTDYKKAGVNIEEGYEAVNLIRKYAEKTKTNGVLNGLGSFAGMFEMAQMKHPVLVSGTDGVGTKLEVAFKKNVYDTVGIDCVAMCVNDIACHGAKPLFFLDYMACGKLEKEKAALIVKGISEGCLQSGAALLGGETAEMPGFYDEGKYDIAGFAVGVIEKDEIINGSDIRVGDRLIGVASSGLHSNGFSLVRHLIKDYDADFNGEPIWKELLIPTKIYVKTVQSLIEKFNIKGLSHITGGGLYENVPRMSSVDFVYKVKKDVIPKKAIFDYIASLGVSEEDMYNTFNMGVGLVICVAPEDEAAVLAHLNEIGENAFTLGQIEDGGKGLCLI